MERTPEIPQHVEDVQTAETGLCDTRYLLKIGEEAADVRR